ncbi:MAG: hypothetical protein KJO49_05560 [Bacteroidia bacterium]|nr:hypothetical protein [Bacteroidia bacterium]MBT8268532.1 hypothetical protein [Bacteroidia bacterium]NNF83317.1 hypothetical protein [Flavobacteriaceae bacterium]NNK71191.1 hypothetical protein [Flavobacteriaceae bacterium]NNL81002.1 hypothetical protein [Flavobacteriaceae bacterium]
MRRTKLLLAIIVVLVTTFFGFVIFQQQELSDYVRPLLLPMVLVMYCASGYSKSTYFFLFLLLYSLAEFLTVAYYNSALTELFEDPLYYLCNTLYIFAYIFLTIEVLRNMELSKIFSRFSIHLIILLILDIYCVMLVTDVAVKSGALVYTVDHVLEFTYNVVIMALLTITLVNYLHRDTKKAMNLLLGSLCIVFSEVIQVAYYYVSEITILSIAYNLLLILAFVFFYLQIGMSTESSMQNKPAVPTEVEA